MAAVDQMLIDPVRADLREALAIAFAAANRGQSSHGRLAWPPANLDAVLRRVSDEPEGGHEWRGLPGRQTSQALIAVVWWSDFLRRKHVRLTGGDGVFRRRARPLLPDPNLPALACVYPRRTLFRERAGLRQLLCVCPCGAWGPAGALAWMGVRCGACHDRLESGEGPPERFPNWDARDAAVALAIAPEGRHMAVRGRRKVWLWGLPPEQPLAQFGVSAASETEIAFNGDGTALAWTASPGSGDSRVVVQEVDGEHRLDVLGSRFAFGGDEVIVQDGVQLVWYGWPGGEERRRVNLPPVFATPGWSPELVFAPDRRLAAVHRPGVAVIVVDLRAGVEVGRFPLPNPFQSPLAFSPDGRTLAVTQLGVASQVIALDTATLQPRFSFRPPVVLVLLTFAGSLLIARGGGLPHASVRAFDATTGAERGTLMLPGVGVRHLAVTADAVVLAGEDHTIRFLPIEVLGD
jgi:hypothetical protein